MNVTKFETQETMSSLEISRLTGKNHFDVMRDIRSVLAEAEIGESRFASSYLSPQNKSIPMFRLPRRECDLVISGYSVKYRLAIIDRWRELEGEGRVPKTRLELAKEQVILIQRLEDAEKETQELKIVLDEEKTWASVKRMEKIHGIKFDWRVLKDASVKLEIDRRDVFDANYGTVKSYHADVWLEAYNAEIL